MSAFLYWSLQSNVDKTERATSINLLFKGPLWDQFSVVGQFYPLNLRGITVKNGLIDNYTNIQSCDYETGVPVFYESTINFDDRGLPDKLDRTLFKECKFSSNLAISFQAKELADESSHEIVRDNIYKILKVGFRANHFSWKSKDVYKKATVVGKYSLDAYLSILTSNGVLINELSKAGSDPGYIVSADWYIDARKLVEEKNMTSRVKDLVSGLPLMLQ